MGNTITITTELKAANEGKLDAYEIGQVVPLDESSSFDGECQGECKGNWVKVGGQCICDTAPANEN